jgi:predicted DNA-binding mobile mystery protein A
MTKTSAQVRVHLDARLARLRLVSEEPRPKQGWIRTVRDALGMSSTELAARMHVGQSSISGLEHRETSETIRLHSLRRAANALDCDLVYFFVPRSTLNEAVLAQAQRKATQLHRDQNATVGDLAEQLADSRGLWSEA